MLIAVISDLHLGEGDSADTFGHDDGEFTHFLRFLEGNFERIVLLGDIWETLTGTVPWRAKRSLRRAKEAHPTLARRFERRPYTFVHGNHDLIARETDGAPSELVLESDGKRLLFMHGHQYQARRMACTARRCAEFCICLGGWLRRARLGGLYQRCERLESAWACAGATPGSRFQRWAVGLAEHADADIIVTGHTHLARQSEHRSCLYLNSGSCNKGRVSYLALDTRKDRYQVHASW